MQMIVEETPQSAGCVPCLMVNVMKLLPDVGFISFHWAVSDRFSTNHKQINTQKGT